MRFGATLAIVLYIPVFMGLGLWALAADRTYGHLRRIRLSTPKRPGWEDWIMPYQGERYHVVLFEHHSDPELERARKRALRRWALAIGWAIVDLIVFALFSL